MSISQRINNYTKEKLNELQAKIILLKKKKFTINELIDKIVLFSIQNEKKFIEFLTENDKQENIKDERDSFLNFILTPIEGAGPEDFEEYDFDED